MELRRHLLTIFGALALAIDAGASPIRTYPLDDRAVYAIAIGQGEPTTCLFPAAPSALEAANVSAKPEDNAPVLLSYQPGALFFSVRALKPDAKAAVNVVLRGKVLVLRFIAGEAPDRVVAFADDAATEPRTPVLLRRLLDRAKRFDFFAAQYPALSLAVEHAQPNTATAYRNFTVTLEDVFRFDAEDALVFGLRLENPGDTPVVYPPGGLGVRAGREIFYAALSDASGVIPQHGTARAWFVVGAANGARANIPVTAAFTVIVPAEKK